MLFPCLNGASFVVPRAKGKSESFSCFADMERCFAMKDLAPADLKAAVTAELNKLLEPIRKKFRSQELVDLTARCACVCVARP